MTGPGDPAFMWEFRCEQFVFARLAEEQAAAEQLLPGDRELAIARWSAIAFAAAEHTIYVTAKPGNEGIQSAGRCYTCPPVHGVPCVTMCRLARIWAHHPDYQPAWNEYLENVRGTLVLDTWDVVASAGFWNMRLRDYQAALTKTSEEN
ncbi:hypothetical protein [Nonomuraea sp. NPDC005650]|uniref:hypothetical protein n=1 Tax=Nonomuraea sp. NPDC005650 TaxID=3157045 RepID=UPI0033B8491E